MKEGPSSESFDDEEPSLETSNSVLSFQVVKDFIPREIFPPEAFLPPRGGGGFLSKRSDNFHFRALPDHAVL